jgi:hypothetical protein
MRHPRGGREATDRVDDEAILRKIEPIEWSDV